MLLSSKQIQRTNGVVVTIEYNNYLKKKNLRVAKVLLEVAAILFCAIFVGAFIHLSNI